MLRVQHLESACRIREAGLSASPVQSAVQPLMAQWSARPWELALPDGPGAARQQVAAWSSVPFAGAAPLMEAEEAVYWDALEPPPGAVGPLAQLRVAAAVWPALPEVRPRAAAQVAELLQAVAAVLQAAEEAVQPRVEAGVRPVAQAAARLRAEDPLQAEELPSRGAASTCLQPARWDRLAPARSARFAPATARLRTALP